MMLGQGNGGAVPQASHPHLPRYQDTLKGLGAEPFLDKIVSRQDLGSLSKGRGGVLVFEGQELEGFELLTLDDLKTDGALREVGFSGDTTTLLADVQEVCLVYWRYVNTTSEVVLVVTEAQELTEEPVLALCQSISVLREEAYHRELYLARRKIDLQITKEMITSEREVFN